MGDSKPSIQITIIIDGVTTHKKVKMDSFVIGRHQDCDVHVVHPQVSRQHLKITIDKNAIYFEDLGSSNGTFLNKNKDKVDVKRPFLLNSYDIIRLGDTGPTIQIQVEEKKSEKSITLASLPSLPTMPAAVQIASPVKAPPPQQVNPISVQKESDKTLMEANKQAAQIVQKAELQAEAKAQEASKHAVETEQKAEKHFQERLKAANLEAQKIFEEARSECQKLLQETRSQTLNMREQAEKDARELRKSSEEKCIEVLRDAETQGQEIKNKRLSEADAIIEKKGEELLKATYEKIEQEKSLALTQLDSLKAKTSKAREAMQDAEEEKLEVEKKLSEVKREIKIQQDDFESKKISYEKIKSEEKSTLSHLELLKKELKEQEKNFSKQKDESEKLTLSLSSLKQENEAKEKEMSAQLQALKAKIEEEKAQIEKKEEERTNKLKLETAEAIQKFEKELIEEILNKKTQVAKEILLHIEATCPAVALSDDWKSKRSELDQTLQDIIQSSGEASTNKVNSSKSKNRLSSRTKQRTTSLMLGLALGIFAVIGGQRAMEHVDGKSPVQRMVASAIENTKLELEKRKFNPKQVTEVKDNYVDAVIYTKDFTETYLDADYQVAWTKAATKYLLKTWRLDEDRSTKVLAASAALVKDLSEKKEAIHPDFVKRGLEKMRESEKETLARLKEELGGEVRLESFKKFEKKFFEKYERTPASEE